MALKTNELLRACRSQLAEQAGGSVPMYNDTREPAMARCYFAAALALVLCAPDGGRAQAADTATRPAGQSTPEPSAAPWPDVYERAKESYVARQWEKAAEGFAYLVQHAADERVRIEAEFYLAEIAMELNRHDSALRHYDRLAVQTEIPSIAARVCFRRGEALYRMQRWEHARQQLVHFVRTYSKDATNMPYALRYLGDLDLRLNRPDDARRWYELACRHDPNGPFANHCRHGIGLASQLQGDLATARKAYKSVIQLEVGDLKYQALLDLGLTEYDAGELDAAIAAFRQILYEQPQWIDAQIACDWWGRSAYRLASNTLEQGDYQQARQQFRALVREPVLCRSKWAAQAHQRIGDAFYQEKNYEQALRAFLSVEVFYEDYPELQAACLRKAALCYQQLGLTESRTRTLGRLEIPAARARDDGAIPGASSG